MKILTIILEIFKGPLRTGKVTTEELPLYQSEIMFEGLYYSWCVKCGERNHCGWFRVSSLGELDVVCHSCRQVKLRRKNYVSPVAPSLMGWSL